MAALMLVVVTTHRTEHAFWSLVSFLQSKLFPEADGQVDIRRAGAKCCFRLDPQSPIALFCAGAPGFECCCIHRPIMSRRCPSAASSRTECSRCLLSRGCPSSAST